MSIKQTKENFLELLSDADNKVIALSGKWGTGKTHLWGEVRSESKDKAVKEALYTSLFGLSGIDQLKQQLIKSMFPDDEKSPPISWKTAMQAVSSGFKAVENVYKGFAALNELKLLLLVPIMLRNKVIVIDDIERKNEKLDIGEILGFIDEYTRQHKARFVLVLNSDQLDRHEVWDTLREKVIDHELKLLTSPGEAFDIASKQSPSRYDDEIRRASIACGLTNIRIIRKVIKTANRILCDRPLDGALLARVVPSIVLFSAIHFKGLEDGPDFQFALNIGSTGDWLDFNKGRYKVPTDEEKRRTRWRLLMHEIGIHVCDEFENLVVDFLESGSFDSGKLEPIIIRYIDEKKHMEALEKANQFLKKVYWDPKIDDTQLLNMGMELQRSAGLLGDPYLCSDIVYALEGVHGGNDVGQNIINAWIDAYQGQKHKSIHFDNPLNQKIHPNISAVIDQNKTRVHDGTTVLDACMHLIEFKQWGTMQEIAMKRATAAEFESVIRDMDSEKMRKFMRGMIEMRLQRETYESHFGTAIERFVEACRAIALDRDSTCSRLAAVIKRYFEKASLVSDLQLNQVQSPDSAAQVDT